MRVFHLSAPQIVEINRLICAEQGNPHHCFEIGKIESAIHSAFYPGAYPFEAGGIARIAGALCFNLIKSHAFMDGNKRTAAVAAMFLLQKSNFSLQYSLSDTRNQTALTSVLEDCATGAVSKDQLMDWFEAHKFPL